MTSPLPLPDWVPYWVHLAILLALLFVALMLVLMPFSVFGTKSRSRPLKAGWTRFRPKSGAWPCGYRSRMAETMTI